MIDPRYMRGTIYSLIVAGALKLASATPFAIRMDGQVFGPADDAIQDSVNAGYAEIIAARRNPQGSGDTARKAANPVSSYFFSFRDWSPELDTLDTLDFLFVAPSDTNYRAIIPGFVARKPSPANNRIPTVFLDAPYAPYDTTTSFGLSIKVIDTSALAGRGLVGRTFATAYLERVPSKVCTTEVFTNGRTPGYPSWDHVMINLERKLINVYDDDTARIRVVFSDGDSDYVSEDLVPLKPSVEGQAHAIETLALYQYVEPHVGIKEEKGTLPVKAEFPPSRVMSQAGLSALVDSERRNGNRVRLYNASGKVIPSGNTGRVNFMEIEGRGRNMGNKGRRMCKVVCPNYGSRMNRVRM
jgi:hypothetical protein